VDAPAAEAARLEALSLLAAILELPDREALLARRTKALLAVATAACVAVLLSGIWQWWLTTPEGSFYLARRTLLERAGQNEVADTPIVIAAAAFGRLNDRRAVEEIANFVSDDMRKATVLASGLASLPEPDCPQVDREIRKLDHSAIRAWPEAMLLAVARCGTAWPEAHRCDALRHLVRQLAWAGLHDRARTMAESVGAGDQIEAIAAMLAYSVPVLPAPELAAWRTGRDPHDLLASVTGLLVDVDVFGAGLRSPFAAELLRLGVSAAADSSVTFANTWELTQQLAAQLAGAGQREEALALLTRTADPPGSCPAESAPTATPGAHLPCSGSRRRTPTRRWIGRPDALWCRFPPLAPGLSGGPSRRCMRSRAGGAKRSMPQNRPRTSGRGSCLLRTWWRCGSDGQQRPLPPDNAQSAGCGYQSAPVRRGFSAPVRRFPFSSARKTVT
jgi:hypothetical protein